MSTLFEKIINREIPAKIIYEDDQIIAFLDISQATKGHTLVVPKETTESVLTASEDIVALVNIHAKRIAHQLMKVFKAQGVNILTNAQEVAGQTVDHYHVHVIPRYNHDELAFKPQPNQLNLEEVYQEFLNASK